MSKSIPGPASIAALLFAALAPIGAHGQDIGPGEFRPFSAKREDLRISNFSGLAVPRYSSLRSEEVNGRAGPSLDYPVQWVYHRAGLPVIVVRESEDWRKIRDPVGDEVWIHKSLLAAERTVIAQDNGEMRRAPDPKSPLVAYFAPGAVMALSDCEGPWCRVEAEGRRGWSLRSHLWGAEPISPVGADSDERP